MFRWKFIIALFAFLVVGPACRAASDHVIPADSAEALRAALQASGAGATIELAPGHYGSLGINVPYGDPWGDFGEEVTIRSADPGRPATFSSIYLRGVRNLTMDGLAIHYTLPAGVKDPLREVAVVVRDCKNITIRNSVFQGDLLNDPSSEAHGFPVGFGLTVRGSQGVHVRNNEFSSWYRGAAFSQSSDIIVKENDVHTIRSDGFNFAAVQKVVIEGNHLHDFVSRDEFKDHRDMIQFWTRGTHSPSTDIIIRDNVLDSGSGVYTQSIFMRNELVDSYGAGREMFYRNINIENNLIHNAHLHGVTVGEAEWLTIANNTLLQNLASPDRGNVSRPRINVAERSKNVLVTYNIAEGVPEPSRTPAGWILAYNLIVQNKNPRLPNYYGNLFINSRAGGHKAALAGLQARPGGIVEQGGYGSSLTRPGCGDRCNRR